MRSAECYGRYVGEAAGDGIGADFVFIEPLLPGAGEVQFVSSAVSDPGCDPAGPEGEFDEEPLLSTGWLPVRVRFMFEAPQGAGLADGDGCAICECAITGTEARIPVAAAAAKSRVKFEQIIGAPVRSSDTRAA